MKKTETISVPVLRKAPRRNEEAHAESPKASGIHPGLPPWMTTGNALPAANGIPDVFDDDTYATITSHLHRVLNRRGVVAQDRADVIQETWLLAWRLNDRWRGDCSAKTWMTSLAINALHKHLYRCRGRRREVGVDIERPSRFTCGGDPVSKFLANSILDQFCPPRARGVLYDFYVLGYSSSEIAAATGRSSDAVEGRLEYARNRIRLRIGSTELVSPSMRRRLGVAGDQESSRTPTDKRIATGVSVLSPSPGIERRQRPLRRF